MKKIFLAIIPLFIGTTCFFSCKNGNSSNPVIVDVSTTKAIPAKSDGAFSYNLSKPDASWRLPDALVEVSGNTWLADNQIILIEDIHPVLYFINLNGDKAVLKKSIPFAEQEKDKVDIEDVTIMDSTVYALWSHGVLFKITNWNGKASVEKIETGLTKKNNTEGLCYDPVTKKLLIACKDESGIEGDKKSAKAVYSFNTETNKLDSDPFLVIKPHDFEEIAGNKIKFNPSAIAIHPVTHEIYLLTTRDNKGMAIFNRDGKLISYQEIDKDLMPQPEGICFSPSGVLYISSEGKKGEPGNLFQFNQVKK
jgi:uncharacterized protein YjiK